MKTWEAVLALRFLDGNCVGGFILTSEVDEDPSEAGFGTIAGGTKGHLFFLCTVSK